MQKTRLNSNKIEKSRKKIVAITVLIVFNLLLLSFAWYYYQTHFNFKTEEREVMPPYCLYLVEPNGTDKLQLTIGNLHPGETKQVVVGVSNDAPQESTGSMSISRNSRFNYELELAYTKNLPVNYKVYALEKVENANPESAQGSNIVVVEFETNDNQVVEQVFKGTLLNKNDNASSELTYKNNEEMYNQVSVVNMGQYDVYDNTNNIGFELTTSTDEAGTVTFDLDYYMIEIEWQNDISFADYLKETDLIYVMVKALQLEPEEQ